MRAQILASMLLTGGGTLLSAESLDNLTLLRVLDLKGTTYHVQGVDTDSKNVWATSVNTSQRKGYLHKFRMATGESVRAIEIQDGDRFHPGGIALDAKSLWVPVAEHRASSTTVIQRRNEDTLQLEFQFDVQDHIGCLAVTPDFLIGGNWDTRDFYIWNHAGKLIRKIASSTGNGYQDMKFDARYVIASGLLPDGSGAIDWLALPSLNLIRRMNAGKTDRGVQFTREGMSIRGSQLFLLPEDGPSRLFVFHLGR
jgi:hypothetical protein